MTLTLKEKRQETKDVTSFVFTTKEKFSWQPGQYVHYVLHHLPTDDRGSDRWFTNAAAPFEKQIMITTRQTKKKGSSFKKKLFSMKEGKNIEVATVSGDFIVTDSKQEYVFLAAGIGITPFRSILKQLDHDKKQIKVTLLYANHDKEIVYKEELEKLAKQHPDFTIHYIFSPEHINAKNIKSVVANLHKPFFYISGPEPMVDTMGAILKRLGIRETHIRQDWFPGYPTE